MTAKPYIVGICGGSASGKTRLLHNLQAKFEPDALTVVSQDNYYRKLEEQNRTKEGLVNFDHPDSLHLDRFLADIKALLAGNSLLRKTYTFNNPESTAEEFWLRPSPILVVEGLFIYYLKEMRDLYDLRLFVDAEEYIRLARRLKRDNNERGYPQDEVLRDYQKFVGPMYYQYVLPTRAYCDLVVMNNHSMDQAEKVLAQHLRQVIQERS